MKIKTIATSTVMLLATSLFAGSALALTESGFSIKNDSNVEWATKDDLACGTSKSAFPRSVKANSEVPILLKDDPMSNSLKCSAEYTAKGSKYGPSCVVAITTGAAEPPTIKVLSSNEVSRGFGCQTDGARVYFRGAPASTQ